MMVTPRRYSVFIDDANRERARKLEHEMATTFSGLVRDLIRAEHERLLASREMCPSIQPLPLRRLQQ
jgi:hypothetical protein